MMRLGKRDKIGNKEEKGRKEKEKAGFKIRLLNVQGWSDYKYMEIKKEFLIGNKDYNLIGITETQEKVEKVETGEGVFALSRMRREKDKKGGGLMLIGKKDERVKLEVVKGGRHKDVLIVEGVFFGMDVRMVLV